MSTFAIGSLVEARGRDWVVLLESEEDPPLGGTDDEITGLDTYPEEDQRRTFSVFTKRVSANPPTAPCVTVSDYRALRDSPR